MKLNNHVAHRSIPQAPRGPEAGGPRPQGGGPRGPEGRGPQGPEGRGPQGPEGRGGPQGPEGRGPQGPEGRGPQGPEGRGPQGPEGRGGEERMQDRFDDRRGPGGMQGGPGGVEGGRRPPLGELNGPEAAELRGEFREAREPRQLREPQRDRCRDAFDISPDARLR